MEGFLLKIILEIESASTEKLQNAADASFCNFSVEAASISSQSSREKPMVRLFHQGYLQIFF